MAQFPSLDQHPNMSTSGSREQEAGIHCAASSRVEEHHNDNRVNLSEADNNVSVNSLPSYTESNQLTHHNNNNEIHDNRDMQPGDLDRNHSVPGMPLTNDNLSQTARTIDRWVSHDMSVIAALPISNEILDPRTVVGPCGRHRCCRPHSHSISQPNLVCHDQTLINDSALADLVECGMAPLYAQSRQRTHTSRRGRRHRQRRRRRRRAIEQYGNPDDEGLKPCCSVFGCKICLSVCLQFKKVLVFLTSIGVLCILVGIILGILRAPLNSFLALALMFVGLGILLLTVVLIGWRCTPPDHEPCHMLFGLGSYSTIGRRGRRRRERLYWLGGRLYPEFRHRRPPPSYASSMHEQPPEPIRLPSLSVISDYHFPDSPPPTYKLHTSVARPGIHIVFPRNDEYPNSNPPTYRRTQRQDRPSVQEVAAVLNDNTAVAPEIDSSTLNLTTADVLDSSAYELQQIDYGSNNLSFEAEEHLPPPLLESTMVHLGDGHDLSESESPDLSEQETNSTYIDLTVNSASSPVENVEV